MKPYWILILHFLLLSCSKENIQQYAATESYPNDTFLASVKDKKAMVVIAHDDDMCAMTGTLSILNKQGWEIEVLSLLKSESRNKAHQKACSFIADSVLFMNLSSESLYKNYDKEKRHYEAFPKDQFAATFKIKKLKEELLAKISHFQPSIIFTLDNEFGGYGHPEHVLISQSVIDLTKDSLIFPKAIYQSVFTKHMEGTIMARHSKRMKSWGFDGSGWQRAKDIYQLDGMPEPSVQIEIKSEAEAKMNYLMSYNERERKTIGFFIPAFQEYSAEEYFSVFDREFFRVLEPDELKAMKF
jgi:LmbE family N-acetylglucosaminyl deacetylase